MKNKIIKELVEWIPTAPIEVLNSFLHIKWENEYYFRYNELDLFNYLKNNGWNRVISKRDPEFLIIMNFDKGEDVIDINKRYYGVYFSLINGYFVDEKEALDRSFEEVQDCEGITRGELLKKIHENALGI